MDDMWENKLESVGNLEALNAYLFSQLVSTSDGLYVKKISCKKVDQFSQRRLHERGMGGIYSNDRNI